MKFDFKLDDAKARAAFKAAPQTMTTIIGEHLERAAAVVAKTARQEESPKGATSQLSNSIKPHWIGPLEILVSAGVDYAPYVHGGRKPGKLPFRFEKGANGQLQFDEGSSFYQWVKSIAVGTRRSRSKQGRQELRDAMFLIGHAISKRGIKPNPFMERTFTRDRSRVEKLMRDGIEAGIRLATWGEFSHVAQVAGDRVIEAVWHPGVREAALDHAIARASRWAIVEYRHANPEAMIAAARSQIGKPYDKTGVLGLGLHRDWQEDDAWWCSELIPWAAAQACDPWFRAESMHRITPQHLWMRHGRIVASN